MFLIRNNIVNTHILCHFKRNDRQISVAVKYTTNFGLNLGVYEIFKDAHNVERR